MTTRCLLLTLLALPIALRASEVQNSAFGPAIERARQRCVKIYGAATQRTDGFATGILVSSDGDILSALGVWTASQRIRVVLADGEEHQAQLIKQDRRRRLVHLRIKATIPQHFNLATAPTVRRGDWVLAVANAFNVAQGREPIAVSLGTVSGLVPLQARAERRLADNTVTAMFLDTITANSGAPGGALVDTHGRILGMIGAEMTSVVTNTQINYGLPADQLLRFFKSNDNITQAPAAKPVDHGIRLFALGGNRGKPLVERVITASPASQAGLRKGDLILAIDGQRVPNLKTFKKLAAGWQPGATLNIQVKRRSGIDTLTLQLIAGDKQ